MFLLTAPLSDKKKKRKIMKWMIDPNYKKEQVKYHKKYTILIFVK